MSNDFTIDTKALGRAAQALGPGFRAIAGKTVEKTLGKAGSAVSKKARAEARRHTKTGRSKLPERVRSTRRGRLLDTVVKVRAGGPIAHLVIGGTKAHEIQAGAADALAIHATSRGGAIETTGFASHVSHPGATGDGFFARGVDEAEPEMRAYLQLATDQMAQELARKILS